MAIKAVIWDVGGVLMRTEDYTSRDQLARNMGMVRSQLEDLVFGLESGRRAQLGEIPIEQHWENLRQCLGLTKDEMHEFRDSFWGGDSLDTALIDYVRSLRKKFKTGVLSNAFSNLRFIITDNWKVADAFDQMIISAEVGLMKPDARIYQLAVQSLDVAYDEAVFIDDFQHNVDGALAVNMQAIHFKNPTQVIQELKVLLRDGA